MKFFTNPFLKPSGDPERCHAVPAGTRIYAVGDIHGRYDLLERLLDRIAVDAGAAAVDDNILIMLGDYIDRGPQSREVIERLSGDPLPGFTTICLRGNHEAALLDFFDSPSTLETWSMFGGRETLLSYGVPADMLPPESRDTTAARDLFCKRLPTHHRAFFAGLSANAEIGDYIFVHAGLRPGVPVARQDETDMIWIRHEFLQFKGDFGKKVVHGHTPVAQPEVHVNRINVDTGAYYSNRLTCVVLEGTAHRFVTSGDPDR